MSSSKESHVIGTAFPSTRPNYTDTRKSNKDVQCSRDVVKFDIDSNANNAK